MTTALAVVLVPLLGALGVALMRGVDPKARFAALKLTLVLTVVAAVLPLLGWTVNVELPRTATAPPVATGPPPSDGLLANTWVGGVGRNLTAPPVVSPAEPIGAPGLAFDWRWLVGLVSASLLVKLVRDHVSAKRLAARATPWRDGVRLSDEIDAPISLPGGTILLPSDAQAWPDAKLALVLAHEGSHREGRDAEWITAFRAVACLAWWSPGLWLLDRMARAEAERCADDAVLRTGVSSVDYADCLVAFASSPSSGKAGLSIGHGGVEARVRRLLQGRQKPSRLLGSLGIAVLIAAGATACVRTGGVESSVPAAIGADQGSGSTELPPVARPYEVLLGHYRYMSQEFADRASTAREQNVWFQVSLMSDGDRSWWADGTPTEERLDVPERLLYDSHDPQYDRRVHALVRLVVEREQRSGFFARIEDSNGRLLGTIEEDRFLGSGEIDLAAFQPWFVTEDVDEIDVVARVAYYTGNILGLDPGEERQGFRYEIKTIQEMIDEDVVPMYTESFRGMPADNRMLLFTVPEYAYREDVMYRAKAMGKDSGRTLGWYYPSKDYPIMLSWPFDEDPPRLHLDEHEFDVVRLDGVRLRPN